MTDAAVAAEGPVKRFGQNARPGRFPGRAENLVMTGRRYGLPLPGWVPQGRPWKTAGRVVRPAADGAAILPAVTVPVTIARYRHAASG